MEPARTSDSLPILALLEKEPYAWSQGDASAPWLVPDPDSGLHRPCEHASCSSTFVIGWETHLAAADWASSHAFARWT